MYNAKCLSTIYSMFYKYSQIPQLLIMHLIIFCWESVQFNC